MHEHGTGRGGSPNGTTAVSATSAFDAENLREQLVGLTMASEVCARWLDRDSPDLGEVRALVAEMILVSQRALASLAR